MCRLKQLDEDECIVGEAPPTYSPPNDGFIPPPNLIPLPNGSLSCGVDGLTYHLDGRLYIQRNETDNTTYATVCDFYHNVSSGCLLINNPGAESTFFAVGDPTVSDLTVNIIHPGGVYWWRFDILSSSDYDNVTTPGFTPGPLADYNLTSVESTNCTVALFPLVTPLTPGYSCATTDDFPEDHRLRFRASDNYPASDSDALTTAGVPEAQVYYFLDGDLNDILDYNGTTLLPLVGEAEEARCTINTASETGVTCVDTDVYHVSESCSVNASNAGQKMLSYGGRIVHPRLPSGTCFGYNGPPNSAPPATDYVGTCATAPVLEGGTDTYMTCRYNRWRMKSGFPYFGYDPADDSIDESMLDSLTLQTFDNLDTEIPCVFEIDTGYFCDANNHSWASYSGTPYPLYYLFNNTPPYVPVPCFNNSRQTPTMCRDVELNYTDGRSVHVRLDGQVLTYTVNGVDQPLACDIYIPQGSSISSMDTATLMEGYHTRYTARPGVVSSDTNGTYWKSHIKTYVSRVRASLMLHVADTFPKDAFLCCLADTVNHVVRTLVSFVFEWAKFFRSIMALPAYFNDIEAFDFDMPTFRTAKDELREAFCRFACTITRILPDILNCSSLETDMGCGSTAVCATGLLCHTIDIPLLVLEVVVEILETLRSLIRDDEPNINNGLNNDACQLEGQEVGCIAGMIMYIIIKVVFTVTRAIRDLAAFINCFFCGIGSVLGLGDQCDAVLYQFVNGLMNLIDGLTETILQTIVKLLMAIVQFFIYLFSGTENAFTLALEQIGNIFIYLGDLLLNLGQLILEFLLEIPIIGTIVRFFVNVVGEICGVIQDIVDFFTNPDQDIGCPPVDWESLKKRGVMGTYGWLKNVKPEIQQTWDTELPVCRARMTVLNNTAYEEITDSDRLDLFFCLFSYHWIHEVAPESTVYATVCEQQVLDFYDQRILWSQIQRRTERAEVQWCGRMRWAMYQLREKGGYDYLPENLLDNPLLFIGFGVQMLYGYDVFSQYSSDRNTPIEILSSEEYRWNWQVTGFGTAQLDALAALPSDEDRRIALATDDPSLGLELEQYAGRMSSVFKFKASALAASARFWGRLFGQEPLYPQASVKRSAVPRPTQSLLFQFFNSTIRKLARQKILPAVYTPLSRATLSNASVINRQAIHQGMRAVVRDIPIILAKTAIHAADMDLTGRAVALGTSIPRTMYAASLALFKIAGDVLAGRANPLSAAWARSHPKETLQYAMGRIGSSMAAPWARVGRGPGELWALTARLWDRSPTANKVRGQLAYLGSAISYAITHSGQSQETFNPNPKADDVTCEIPYPDVCEQCGVVAIPLNTLLMAPTQAVVFYTGPNTTDPSFAHSQIAYEHLRDMLSDKSIPAEIGDSPDLPMLWPWNMYNNLRILGDPTPGKGRLLNLTNIFWSVVDGLYAAPAVVADGVHTTRNLLVSTADYLIRFYSAVLNGRSVSQVVQKTTQLSVATLGGGIANLLNFFVDWLRSCSYRNEINGSTKQFSIAETLGILGLVVLGLALLLNLFIPSNAMTFFVSFFGLFSAASLLGFPLVIAYMYTQSCFPAIPYQLADDLLWAVTRTLWPQCDWLLSGIITNVTAPGVTAYTATECRECDNYDDDTGWDVANCFDPTSEGGLGFQNVGRNLGFTLLQWFPDTVQSWNNTQWPVLSTLIHTRIVQGFFTNFTAYNVSDPVSFANHWSCNLVHSAVPNYYISLPIFKIIAIAMPLAMVVLTLLYGLLYIAFWVVMMGEAAQSALSQMTHVVGSDADPSSKGRNLMGEMMWLGRRLAWRTRTRWAQFRLNQRRLYYRL
jgi:hypothetical protein